MSGSNSGKALQQLLDLAIISPGQRDLALNHPLAAELETLSDDSEVLFWLITRDIFPEEDFKQFIQTETQSAWLATEKDRQRLPILSATHALLQKLKKGMNQSTIEQLLNDKLITPAQCELAQANASEDEVFGTPAQALAWILMMGYVTPEEHEKLRLAINNEPAFAGAQSRAQTLTEAEALLKAIETAYHKVQVRAFWGEVFPGPGWLWIGGVVLGLAGFIWYLVTPTAPPSCTSSDVKKTLDRMMLMTNIEVRSRNPLSGLRESSASDYISIRNLKTVGYAKADKTRGCLATLTSGGEENPYAYTIGPKRDAEGKVESPEEFMIIGANPEIVTARFGNLTEEGDYAHQALPIGRNNLEKAFRAGADDVSKAASDLTNAMILAMGQLQKKPSSYTKTDTNREREIAEVEPVGECQPLVAGKSYRCPLMIERNNPLMAAITGGGNTILQGNFTFELKNNHWQVSANFANEFATAVSKSRGELNTDPVTEASAPAASAVAE